MMIMMMMLCGCPQRMHTDTSKERFPHRRGQLQQQQQHEQHSGEINNKTTSRDWEHTQADTRTNQLGNR